MVCGRCTTSRRPSQVSRGDALGFIEHDAQLVQWLDHLDAQVAHTLVEPVLIDGATQADGRLLVTPTHQ